MRSLLVFWHRVVALVRRGRLERDLNEELAFHLAMREREYTEAGLSPGEARGKARRDFGNPTYLREKARDMWLFPSLDSLWQDVRFASRTLRKAPGFTTVALLALAMAIGGNTAMFSLLNSVRAASLPYEDPGRLVVLWGNVVRSTVERRGASDPDFADWRAQATSFEGMAAYDAAGVSLSGDHEPERITVETVSAGYFELLGVAAAHGRTFRADEDLVAGRSAVTVLGDGLWKRRFGGDPGVVGRTIVLNGQSYTVVGVAPPAFGGLTDAGEAWIPFVMGSPPDTLAERGSRWFRVLARLRPGGTLAQAQAEMDGISSRLERAYPVSNAKRGVEVIPLDAELFGDLRPALNALMAAVGFVLLIACANVANLLIARSEARQREIALRAAVGAGRGRLLRQLVTEGCLLASLGATLGLLLARVAVPALLAASPVGLPRFVEPRLDVAVASFTVAVTLVCGVLLGLAPAVHARGGRLSDALKDSARGSDGRGSQRLRGTLVVAEVGLAVVLLVGAGLMIRTVRNLAAVDPGFDAGPVVSVAVNIPRAEGAAGQARPPLVASARAILERVRAVPGVAVAALATDVPLGDDSLAVFYSAEGQPPVTAQTVPRAYVHRVTPEFFAALRIPIEAGRTFTDAELSREASAVIVSERVTRRFWPGSDPIGKRIKVGSPTSKNPWLSIVGVVRETKYRGLPDNPTADPDLYFPFFDGSPQVSIVVRAGVEPASVVPSIRAAVRAEDATITVFDARPLQERVERQSAPSRFTMWLMGVFAFMALLLAVLGIYGVMAYLVAQRTREIGIRMALGARGEDILRLVGGNGVRLIGLGILVGVGGAFAVQRLVSSLLFGVTAADAATVITVGLLAVVALAACYLPAWRATRIDPLHALRRE